MRWLVVGVVLASPAWGMADDFKNSVQPFLRAHCVKCHGATKPKGDFRLDDITADPKDAERWLLIRDQIRDGLMPPAKEAKPPAENTRRIVAWANTHAHAATPKLPNQGNLIPHELLFGKASDAPAATAARVWRLSPDGYMGLVRELTRAKVGVVQPFTLVPERGLRDYAGLYAIDEPSTEILLRNAEAIVLSQTAHEFKDGKFTAKNDTIRELVALMNPTLPPTAVQLETAIHMQFKLALGRSASSEELERFRAFYDKCRQASDSPTASRTMLQAILLKTDALYRSELGRTSGNRTLLTPTELVRALSLALGERRDGTLATAAQKGELQTPEQIATHVQRLLDDPKADKSRLLKFFREYFEYHKAEDVFKDKPKSFVHLPRQLVLDTDRLVLHILANDRDVLKEMLTTPHSFVNYTTKQNKQTRKDEPMPAVVLNPTNDKGKQGLEFVYGVAAWPKEQPALLPEGTRLGILMQPSWLAAWSTNFDNDPVRRGRWIRERLLGGTVPDLPIGVAAQVPDEPHRSFRDRLQVTRESMCWKCHNRMDELGLPFEQFDHYGLFRTTEAVRDLEATAKNLDKKGNPLGPVTKEIPLVTTGTIADSGDAALDGPIRDPRELVRKLASSTRVRQVFVRHAFRYFLGRNETLADARTLQEADRAYVHGGGSFKALVLSLLTSDSFLYRTALPSPMPGTR